MKTTTRLSRTVASLLALVSLASAVSAADVRVYLRYAPGQKGGAQAALAQARAQTHHVFDDLEAMAVTLPEQARAALQRNPAVTLLEDDPVRGYLTVALPAQTTPYGIAMVNAPAAIAAGATGAGIKIGVVDSGVYAAHPDFAGLMLTGYPDFGANDQRTWYRDIDSHGTHVVGTIAAANNSLGVVGVSPGGVSIHMVKVFGDTGGWVYSSDLLAACRQAQSAGAKVISMSLGGGTKSRTEEQGMNDLYNKKGVLLVAAAGNAGNTTVSYPAGYGTVISVAAIDSGKALGSFSQRNSDVELSAPGVAVLSTVSYTDTTTVSANGTGYAGTHVEFSGRDTVSAQLVYGGLGTAINAAWSGKVVLVDRGTNSFNEKVQNVQSSGGVACVIINNVAGELAATLGDGNSSAIPAIGVNQTVGASLNAAVGTSATVSTAIQQPAAGYDFFDGTSMATPHVSGVAALIWSKYPGATNAQVRQALTSSAEDLGAAGRDSSFGFGLVRADAALTALAALNPPPPSGDTTAPTISNVAARVTNANNGSFEITWTTNEPATSDVQLNGTLYPDSTLVVNHRRTFRGSRGATYTYVAISADAAGNSASSAPRVIVIQ